MKEFKPNLLTAVFGCYIIYLSYLVQSGEIKRFINPRLSFLTVLAIIILGAMLVYNLKTNMRSIAGRTEGHEYEHSDNHPDEHDHHAHSEGCSCGHNHSSKTKFSNYILLLPILLSMIIPPTQLSYQSGFNSQPVDIANAPNSFNPQDYSKYVEIPTANPSTHSAGAQPKPLAELQSQVPQEYDQLMIGNIIFDLSRESKQKLLTSKIFLKGKVLRSNLFKPNEIALYRMVITCCAADGMPAGILVKLPRSMDFQNEEWVGVEGRISFRPFPDRLKSIDPLTTVVTPGKMFAYFTADKAYPVTAPPDEYLYP